MRKMEPHDMFVFRSHRDWCVWATSYWLQIKICTKACSQLYWWLWDDCYQAAC